MTEIVQMVAIVVSRTARRAVAWVLPAIIALLLLPPAAWADGGVIRARENHGNLTATVFTPAEIDRRIPADITVLVQRRDTGEPVLDAKVELQLVAPIAAEADRSDPVCGSPMASSSAQANAKSAQPSSVSATRAQSANKLFYGATIVFPSAGTWQVQARIHYGIEQATAGCTFPVGISSSRLASIWPCLALPPLVVFLYILNLALRKQGRNPGSGQNSSQLTRLSTGTGQFISMPAAAGSYSNRNSAYVGANSSVAPRES